MTASDPPNPECPNADPYIDSTAIARVRLNTARGGAPALACLDIDSTLTGRPETVNSVRSLLEEMGFVVIFDTSRTEEMILTQGSYRRSAGEIGRPPPHLGGSHGRHVYEPTEEHTPPGVLDADIIAGSTGTRILVRQTGDSYLLDREYEQQFGADSEWRRRALQMTDDLAAAGCRVALAPIEIAGNYERGISDVFPPTYRIQLNFDTLVDKQRFAAALRDRRRNAVLARDRDNWNIRLTDDSKPEAGAYKAFLTPWKASKAHAIEHIVRRLSLALDIEPSRFRLLFAGDSFPDLRMGLFGGLAADATFLLAGGSRLADCLTGDDADHFAGEPIGAIRRRLTPEGPPGYYRFRLPCAGGGRRRLIVGDEAFPGTEEVETVYHYLRSVEQPG